MEQPEPEGLGDRIRRLRLERGLSLAKVAGGDFSRAFLNQVELGKSQASARTLRIIAARLGTGVEYLIEGARPNLEREVALERARISLAEGHPRRCLAHLRGLLEATDWPFGTDVRLCAAEALLKLGREPAARRLLAAAGPAIDFHRDELRRTRLRAIEGGETPATETDRARHLVRLGEAALGRHDLDSALECFREARVLVESFPLRDRRAT